MHLDYRQEKYTKVRVCGIECDFNDMRIDRSIVPEGRYLYEVADDESPDNPSKAKCSIMVNFFGTLFSDAMCRCRLGMMGYCG